MEILGKIDSGAVISYLGENFGDRVVASRSRYSLDRREFWLGLRWVGPRFVPAPADPRVGALGDRLLPSWAVCGIFLGRGILPHRDHSIFGPSVVSVSLAACRFSVGGADLDLPAGVAVRFASRDLHSVAVPAGELRWSICFWDLPPVRQLSLF